MEEEDCKFVQNAVSETKEQEVKFSENLLDEQKNQDSLLEKKEFLPYGVGPVIDCEIDDDNDEPDYAAYARKRPKNLKLRRKKKKKKGFYHMVLVQLLIVKLMMIVTNPII
uniref:Uncharacterized protein n=1 Tax=Schizaphis graminum TaxID=13262 RepID=A0A2S2PSW9_SCHGA